MLIDGVEHEIEEGTARTVRIGDQDHQLQLLISPYRTFVRGKLSFQFPESMMFAADFTEPVSWQFNVGDTMIMLQEYEDVSERLTRSMLIPGIKSQFEGLESREGEITETFGERTLTGTELVVLMPEIEIVQDIYFFTSSEKVYALFLHDVRDRDAAPTEEFEQVVSVVRESLEFED